MPEQITTNKLWSHSCLSAFECRWAWWRHYQEHLPGHPLPQFEAGSALHKLLEAYLRHLVVTGKPTNYTFAKALAGRLPWEGVIGYDGNWGDPRKAFLGVVEANTFEPESIVGIERWTVAELPEDLGTFRGRIDLLTRDEDELRVIDFKSGYNLSAPPEDPPVQALRYAWLLDQQEEFAWAQTFHVGYLYAGSNTFHGWEVPRPVSSRELVSAVKEVLACRSWAPEPGHSCGGCEYVVGGECKAVALPDGWSDFEKQHAEIERLEAELKTRRAVEKKLGRQIGPQLIGGKFHGDRAVPKRRLRGMRQVWNAVLAAEKEPEDFFGVTPSVLAEMEEDPDLCDFVERLEDGSKWSSWAPEPEPTEAPEPEPEAAPEAVETARVLQLWGVMGLGEAEIAEVYRMAGMEREAELTPEVGDTLFTATEVFLRQREGVLVDA